jgi:hypothetical protein
MFAEAGLPLVHTPGLAVNRARQGIRGGERKSDPKDAVVIAELARTRPDLRAVEPPDPLDAEIRLLVSRRRELVTEQTRRAARLRDLLSGLFPALERRIDPTTRTGLVFLSHYAAPEDIRAAGAKRITRRLTKAATGLRGLEALAEDAVQAAQAQTVTIPGAQLRGRRDLDRGGLPIGPFGRADHGRKGRHVDRIRETLRLQTQPVTRGEGGAQPVAGIELQARLVGPQPQAQTACRDLGRRAVARVEHQVEVETPRADRPGDAEIAGRAGHRHDRAGRDQVRPRRRAGRCGQRNPIPVDRATPRQRVIAVLGQGDRRRSVGMRNHGIAQPRPVERNRHGHVDGAGKTLIAIGRVDLQADRPGAVGLHRPDPAAQPVRPAMQAMRPVIGGERADRCHRPPGKRAGGRVGPAFRGGGHGKTRAGDPVRDPADDLSQEIRIRAIGLRRIMAQHHAAPAFRHGNLPILGDAPQRQDRHPRAAAFQQMRTDRRLRRTG